MSGWRAWLVGVGSFLAGFAGTCALIGTLLDRRIELRLLPGSIEEAKFRHFREHADEYDLVYVGTSRVLRGFDPAAFEERMRALDRPLSAFNFGLVGIGFLEQEHLVDWILGLHPERLRALAIEPVDRDLVWHVPRARVLRAQGGGAGGTNLFTLRDVNWHTPRVAWHGIHAAWSSERDLATKLDFTRKHALQTLHRACNLGVGTSLLGRALRDTVPARVLPNGFAPKEADARPGEEPEVRVVGEEPVPPPPTLWEVFRLLCARARARGVAPLLAVPPTAEALEGIHRARAEGHLAEFLVYSRASFPALFAEGSAYFYDDGLHLNPSGAALFSARLAEDLRAWIEARH